MRKNDFMDDGSLLSDSRNNNNNNNNYPQGICIYIVVNHLTFLNFIIIINKI
jgi:hypothetical protein